MTNTARRTRRKAAHRQVFIEYLGWIVAAVVAGLWIATEWRSWLMVVVGVLVSTAAGMLGAVWMVHRKTRIVSTKPAKREPSLINPPRSKDKTTWPIYTPSEIPEMRDSGMPKVRVYELAKELGVESKTVLKALQDMGESVRSTSSTVEASVEGRLREKLASEPSSPQPSEVDRDPDAWKRLTNSILWNGDIAVNADAIGELGPEPENGFHQVRRVSVDEHRAQFQQALESAHSEDPEDLEDAEFVGSADLPDEMRDHA